MGDTSYPIADTVRGTWDHSANLPEFKQPLVAARELSREVFDPTRWEPNWDNPIARELHFVVSAGVMPDDTMPTYNAKLYQNSRYVASPIGLGSIFDRTCLPSPEGVPSIWIPENNYEWISVTSGLSTYFDYTVGYDATIMWIGVPGNAGSYRSVLSSFYSGGGEFIESFGLALSADARSVQAFIGNSGPGLLFTDPSPLIHGRMNVVITSMPLDITGTLPKPTNIVGRKDLTKPHTGGTSYVNPHAGEWCMGSRGTLDGSLGSNGSDGSGFYTYMMFLWKRELSVAEKVALVKDPTLVLKRTLPPKGRVFTFRNYEANLPLYPQVDEPVANDTDSIYTTEQGATTLKLGPVDDPGGTTGHQLLYRAKSTDSGDLTVTLKQGTGGGAITIATRTHTNVPSTWTEYTMDLSAGEASLITDYSDLYVTLDGTP